MRQYILLIVIVFASSVCGQTDVYVYEADEVTPFEYQDIMVGTKLTLIVNSDSNDYWRGGLFIRDDNRAFGNLSARDYDANTRDYTGSHFEQAGHFAKVTGWQDSSIWGFDMCTFYPVCGDFNDVDTRPGDWFIIDYEAKEAGICNVGFYDYSISWNEPIYDLTFTQVKNRDFNDDGKVDFQDYVILTSNWDRVDCDDPNWCDGTDLNQDGNVNYIDLAGFINFWLWSEFSELPNDCGKPQVYTDPNIILRIVDVNDNNEITIDVNESITLYLRLTTTEQGSLKIFDIESLISDTNLGSIDNREYNPDDPNDPNNGTARILAKPREPFFDYVGPGHEQPEGISLFAASVEADFNDGNLASFVFTCNGQGDVTLSLKNYLADPNPKLESILIHQVDPNLQQMMMGGGDTVTESSQMSEDIDANELVTWLEEIWIDDSNLRKTTTEDDWSQFIETIENTEDPD